MRDVKRGSIVEIIEGDDVGFIREEDTLTYWVFRPSQLTAKQRAALRKNADVIFFRDKNFEHPVAFDVRRAQPQTNWAV